MSVWRVSIHAPTRGATPRLSLILSTRCFNPRAHAGRDVLAMAFRRLGLFQSTRPRGARLPKPINGTALTVSIHAPTRGATCQQFRFTFGKMFQSTRPRGARPIQYRAAWRLIVSIHAPTRGATCYRCRCRGCNRFNPRAHAGRDHGVGQAGGLCQVSIHAPTRGATLACRFAIVLLCFNPRAHAGRDSKPGTQVSTHTGFNPRAHAGRDQVRDQALKDAKFQSTRPRGARLTRRYHRTKLVCFNPRAHAGRDIRDKNRPP